MLVLALAFSAVSLTVFSLPHGVPTETPAAVSITSVTDAVRSLRASHIARTETPAVVPGATSPEQFLIPTDFKSELGSCGLPVDFSQPNIPIVAMGIEDMSGVNFNSPQCGRCVRIQNKLTAIATVVSMCGEKCVPGTIQMNRDLAVQLNGGESFDFQFPIKWEFVPCPGFMDTRMIETATGLPVQNQADQVAAAGTQTPESLEATKQISLDVMQSCSGNRVTISDAVKTPEDAKLAYALPSEGIQIYKCSNATWSLFDASASLFRDCKNKVAIVSHNFYLPGKNVPTPSFYEIGSFTGFQGNVSAKNPVNGTIPELLLTLIKNRPGDEPAGRYDMSKIRFVQRLATEGGVAPDVAECTGEKEGKMRSVPFSSLYTFYL